MELIASGVTRAWQDREMSESEKCNFPFLTFSKERVATNEIFISPNHPIFHARLSSLWLLSKLKLSLT
jgi:hypothetical protein